MQYIEIFGPLISALLIIHIQPIIACGIHSPHKPEQIHLSLADEPGELVLTWVTQAKTMYSVVRYARENEPATTVCATTGKFIDSGSEKRTFFIHRATLIKLIPETSYSYSCGNEFGWTENYTFRTLPSHSNWAPSLAVLGDMGTTNNRALTELTYQATVENRFDVIFHVGDLAYNLDTDNARNGDLFMRQIEPIASQVPYMTAVGNHEFAYNFSNYKARFSMPGGDGTSMFYSVNVGPAHIVVYSTEFYYALYEGWRLPVRQFEWLEKDLEEANAPTNRALRPWIITMAHRPMYCSNAVEAINCATVDNFVRTGYPYFDGGTKKYLLGLEELFYRHGVDLIITAHMHSYERMWPVYNRTVCNGSLEQPYLNPTAPVHVVTGSAGCDEGTDPFIPGGYPWSAYRSDDYGFTRMNIHNHTHLSLEQVSVTREAEPVVIDSFTIVSTQHGPNRFTCHMNSVNAQSYSPI